MALTLSAIRWPVSSYGGGIVAADPAPDFGTLTKVNREAAKQIVVHGDKSAVVLYCSATERVEVHGPIVMTISNPTRCDELCFAASW